MTGTAEFCRKMRDGKHCVFCHDLLPVILPRLPTAVFDLGVICMDKSDTLSRSLHCSAKSPIVFGNALVEQMIRQDLSLQQIAT
jgi:hypothetical protein